MRYVKSTLLKHEKLIYFSSPHWIVFSYSALYLLIAVALLLYVPLPLLDLKLFDVQLHQLLALIVFLYALYTGVGALITYKTSEYCVTNERILMKVGWIRRCALELFLDKVEAIKVRQSIPGRLIGYGTVTIIGTGGSKDIFPYVPEPLKFRRIAQQQLDRG